MSMIKDVINSIHVSFDKDNEPIGIEMLQTDRFEATADDAELFTAALKNAVDEMEFHQIAKLGRTHDAKT